MKKKFMECIELMKRAVAEFEKKYQGKFAEQPHVGLGDRKALLDGTKVYAREFDVNDVPIQECALKTGCINADCVDVAEAMIKDGLNPAILNLASRRRPGGGYDRGMSAQEERECDFEMKESHQYLVNAGSVGYPRVRPCSTYVLFDSISKEVKFCEVEFNFYGYADALAAKDIPIPYWMEDSLRIRGV